jgi:hypothetical protein
MERYLLFAWDQYYPSGGFNDLVSDYESEELARAAWDERRDDWGQIVDTLTGKITNLQQLDTPYSP